MEPHRSECQYAGRWVGRPGKPQPRIASKFCRPGGGGASKQIRPGAMTIDRALASSRARLPKRGISTTRPGTLLKHQVAIKTFAAVLMVFDVARLTSVALVGQPLAVRRSELARLLGRHGPCLQLVDQTVVVELAQAW